MRIRLIILILMLVVSGCARLSEISRKGGGTGSSLESSLDSMRAAWRYYNVRGEYDSLINGSRRYFERAMAEEDTLPLLYAGSFIAQAHLFKDDIDSVRYYLDRISEYGEKVSDYNIKAIYNIVYGCYALKSELDYSKALEYFHNGLHWAELAGDVNNQIVLLANISYIFYTRSDRHGLEYARRAYEISKSPEVADFPRCQGCLVMAQMLQLSEKYSEMLFFLNEADSLITKGMFTSLIPMSSIIYASYYNSKGNYSKADSAFRRAIEFSESTEPSIASYVFLKYGDFCMEREVYGKAVDLYQAGLEISCNSRNNEFRPELLQSLSDSYRKIGDEDKHLYYLGELNGFLDSLATSKKEQDFNSLLLKYQQVEHENELQAKELDLLKANKKVIVSGFVILIALIVIASVVLLYFRQRKMYSKLVQQHQGYMQRLQAEESETEAKSETPSSAVSHDNENKELFLQIEHLMRSDKVYREKDLSLDRLAELVGTNRTYVSKAVNTYSGMTFFNYLDMYRIREATEIISRPGDTTPFKQMADMLGYNSVSVFYKAFSRETGCTPGRYRDEVKRIQARSGIENP